MRQLCALLVLNVSVLAFGAVPYIDDWTLEGRMQDFQTESFDSSRAIWRVTHVRTKRNAHMYSASFNVNVDKEGKFTVSVKNKSSLYLGDNYLTCFYDGRIGTLKFEVKGDSKTIQDLSLKMHSSQGMLRVRVVDPEKEQPVKGLPVQLALSPQSFDNPGLANLIFSDTKTDDKGELVLPAGNRGVRKWRGTECADAVTYLRVLY